MKNFIWTNQQNSNFHKTLPTAINIFSTAFCHMTFFYFSHLTVFALYSVVKRAECLRESAIFLPLWKYIISNVSISVFQCEMWKNVIGLIYCAFELIWFIWVRNISQAIQLVFSIAKTFIFKISEGTDFSLRMDFL